MKFAARLLLALALLLPFRGAMAFTSVLCHPGAGDVPHATAVQAHGDHAAHELRHQHGVSDAAPHDAHDHATPETSSPSCSFCTSACSAPPLPSTAAAAPDVGPPGAERFPPHEAGAVLALTGVPERPPRTA